MKSRVKERDILLKFGVCVTITNDLKNLSVLFLIMMITRIIDYSPILSLKTHYVVYFFGVVINFLCYVMSDEATRKPLDDDFLMMNRNKWHVVYALNGYQTLVIRHTTVQK